MSPSTAPISPAIYLLDGIGLGQSRKNDAISFHLLLTGKGHFLQNQPEFSVLHDPLNYIPFI